MLILRRHLIPLLRAASSLPSPIYHRAFLLSTSAATSSFEDYLVASCGLAPSQARKTAEKAFKEASKVSRKALDDLSFFRDNSAVNPDAVLAVLHSVGFARADVASLVAADPLLLRLPVKKVEPRILALRDRVGLSPPQIVRLLLVGSRALRCRTFDANVEFLISLFGSFEKVLVVTKKSSSLLTGSLDRLIAPNLASFRRSGVRDIAELCSRVPWVLTFSLERVKEFLLRAQELGVPPDSGMFKYAMAVVVWNSKEKVAAKIEFFKSLGCSESDISIAVPKCPNILSLSNDTLLRKFEFLVNEVGMERREILVRPVLFGLSLEKRLVPRHYAMKVLQAKGLLKRKMNFYSLATMGEENFRLRFIDCHKDSVPGLADDYAAASAGTVPSRV